MEFKKLDKIVYVIKNGRTGDVAFNRVQRMFKDAGFVGTLDFIPIYNLIQALCFMNSKITTEEVARILIEYGKYEIKHMPIGKRVFNVRLEEV